jgi:tetratricopeptide (TPR) repeat protein
MDVRIAQFKSLPQRREETWQGGLVPMPGLVKQEQGGAYQPYFPLWVAVKDHKIHPGNLLPPNQRHLSAAVDALLTFALESDAGGYRPRRIEVADSALAEHLSGVLAACGVEVREVEQLDQLKHALNELEKFLARRAPPSPGPLDAPGVNETLLREFAEAAAAFYEAKPWRYLSDIDLIQIENPRPPAAMKCCTVLGAGGAMVGLAFYSSAKALFAFHRAGRAGDMDRLRQFRHWQLSFNSRDEIFESDLRVWNELKLPLADLSAYPLLMQTCNFEMDRAGAKELRFTTFLLRALAETSEMEIDAGRWMKNVGTLVESTEVRLTIPDLLQPPSRQTGLARGFLPYGSVNVSLFADMERFSQQHAAANETELNAALQSKFVGRSFDKLVTRPETPQEQAQEICFQAFDTFGRRRVQLAREALAKSPDCADAYLILAEQAGTRMEEADYVGQAVAAAERTLGPDPFRDDVGHFWGISTTRPYMRARFHLAQTLENLDRAAEAVDHYRELLRLNPNDNQGIRYVLLPRLLAMGREEEAGKLLAQYDEDSAVWCYGKALLAFSLTGPSDAARRALFDALSSNPFLAEMLANDITMPAPDSYQPQSPQEAAVALEELRPALEALPGAREWISSVYEAGPPKPDAKRTTRRPGRGRRGKKR